MFADKARRCSSAIGSGITRKHLARLEKPARGKHSSLLLMLVNYCRKKFFNTLGPADDEEKVFYAIDTGKQAKCFFGPPISTTIDVLQSSLINFFHRQ
jgi:hypothetical protein